jgi:hypothetical protein
MFIHIDNYVCLLEPTAGTWLNLPPVGEMSLPQVMQKINYTYNSFAN